MMAAMTLFNAFSSDSYSISFARHLLDFFTPAYFLASAADSVRNCARYLLARLPYSSPALLTNGPIVLPSSLCILDASTLSSFRPEPYIIVSRYSKARPFPAIPTFVSVDAGRSPLSISSAFALVEPL